MEDLKVSNQGQNLGIAALITAIVTFVIAVIPCIGLIAIIPGIVAIILAVVGMSQASRTNSPRGLLIAGLIIGVIATLISFSQIFVAVKISQKSGKWPADVQNIINDVQENVLKDLEDQNIDIRVESNGDKVEISTGSNKKDLEQKLEDLEGGQQNDTIQNKDDTVQKKE